MEAVRPVMESIVEMTGVSPSRGYRMEARAGAVLPGAEPQMGLQCQGELRGRSLGRESYRVQIKLRGRKQS